MPLLEEKKIFLGKHSISKKHAKPTMKVDTRLRAKVESLLLSWYSPDHTHPKEKQITASNNNTICKHSVLGAKTDFFKDNKKVPVLLVKAEHVNYKLWQSCRNLSEHRTNARKRNLVISEQNNILFSLAPVWKVPVIRTAFLLLSISQANLVKFWVL